MHLEILGFSMGGAYLFRDIFVRFKTMRRKQNLTTALGIQMKIGGNLAVFRDNKASICKKKTPCIALYFTAFKNNCRLIISKTA